MPRPVTVALLAVAALMIGVAQANAAILSSAAFKAPTLRTQWVLDSGDCASVVSISRARKVDSYGYFTRRHYTWSVKDGVYYLRAHALPPATYYVQLQYCHDSDLPKRGNYYCRGSNAVSVRIPSAGR